MKTKTSAMAYAFALLLTFGAGAAQAASDQEADVTVRSVPVRYTTDSLETEEGRQALREQLEAAARRACGSVDNRDLEAVRRWNDCFDTALASAINRVGAERIAQAR